MPRKAREKSKTGIYAVLIKGADASRRLFCDDDDYNEFISRLDDKLDTSAMAFAVCENSVCMIVKESEKGIGWDIKPVTTGYARYYGKRYGIDGGIFERRFKSEPIETPEQLAAQLACVHRLCDVTESDGYTGRYIDDELFITDEAMEILGSRDAYDEAMRSENPVTMFFAQALTDGTTAQPLGNEPKVKIKSEPKNEEKPNPEREKNNAESPEPKSEDKPKPKSEDKSEEKPKPKRKNNMPSWLL